MRFGRILLVCGLTLAALGVSNVSSWSLEQAGPAKPDVKLSLADDRCLGLLNSDANLSQGMHPVLYSDVVARQTAMGLMLGVRYAVGPREGVSATQKAKGVDSAHAHAVARYRHCRSQQTLESFASN